MSDRILGQDRPLCFVHVPKTGGTSLSDAIARHYPQDRVFADRGVVHTDYLQSVIDHLAERVFVTGHFEPDALEMLGDDIDIVTMLRRPDAQGVSQYLHVRSDAENPLHADATRLPLSDFVRTHKGVILCQSIALCRAFSSTQTRFDPRQPDHLSRVLGLLQQKAIVGVTEQAEPFCAALADRMALRRPIELPTMNAAVSRGTSPTTQLRLTQDYATLRQDPELAELFAIEDRVYATAERLARGFLDRRRLVVSRPRGDHKLRLGARRFNTPDGRITEDSVRIPIRRWHGQYVFGPFDRLAVGRYAAEFHLAVSGVGVSRFGAVGIDVFANCRAFLARRWLAPWRGYSQRRRTLEFAHGAEQSVLEFRVSTFGFVGAELVFHGVTLTPLREKASWVASLGVLLPRVRSKIASTRILSH